MILLKNKPLYLTDISTQKCYLNCVIKLQTDKGPMTAVCYERITTFIG